MNKKNINIIIPIFFAFLIFSMLNIGFSITYNFQSNGNGNLYFNNSIQKTYPPNLFVSTNCGQNFNSFPNIIKTDSSSINKNYISATCEDTTNGIYAILTYDNSSEDNVLNIRGYLSKYVSNSKYYFSYPLEPTNYWLTQLGNGFYYKILTSDKCEVPASNIEVLNKPTSSDNYELKVHLRANFVDSEQPIMIFADKLKNDGKEDILKKYLYMKAFVALVINGSKIDNDVMIMPSTHYSDMITSASSSNPLMPINMTDLINESVNTLNIINNFIFENVAINKTIFPNELERYSPDHKAGNMDSFSKFGDFETYHISYDNFLKPYGYAFSKQQKDAYNFYLGGKWINGQPGGSDRDSDNFFHYDLNQHYPYVLLKPQGNYLTFNLRTLSKLKNAKYSVYLVVFPIDGKCVANGNLSSDLTYKFLFDYSPSLKKNKVYYDKDGHKAFFLDINGMKHDLTLPTKIKNKTIKYYVKYNGNIFNFKNQSIDPVNVSLLVNNVIQTNNPNTAQNFINDTYRMMVNKFNTTVIVSPSDNGETNVTIEVKKLTPTDNFIIYNVLPSDEVSNVSLINHQNSTGGKFFIVDGEPVIGWYFNNSNTNNVNITYSVNSTTTGGSIIITQSPILFNGNQIIVNYRQTGCLPGEVELFQLDDLTNSNVSSPDDSTSHIYQVCISAKNYTLGTENKYSLKLHLFNYTNEGNMSYNNDPGFLSSTGFSVDTSWLL